MPGKVKVKVVAGRSLPVMDRSSDTTDAYVEVKLGDTTFKTDVCRKSLNPAWNSDWFRFEADDLELQDEPLQVRVMDYDTYSANDAIGKVYIDLNPLLLPQPGQRPASLSENASISVSATGGTVMSGWLPVYDTMHGIRGEVNLVVKVELFSDLNKFRQSSCGVQFFCCSEVPEGYKAQFLPGFVEELVVNDDPEYKWIDKIRTPRASNEARQLLFMKLSGEVRRKVGLKALELGGNAVIGYRQCFDLEGESGIVVRGIGTAVTLLRLQQQSAQEQLGDSVANAGSTPTRVSRENSAGKEKPTHLDLGDDPFKEGKQKLEETVVRPELRLIPATPIDPNMTILETQVEINLSLIKDTGSDDQLKQTDEYYSTSSSGMEKKNSPSDPSSRRSTIAQTVKPRRTVFNYGRKTSLHLEKSKNKSPLRRSSSEKQPSSNKKPLRRSIRIMKKKSIQRLDRENSDQESYMSSNANVKKKNSFYKIMDKIRGISRKSSLASGQTVDSGQTEFLESMSKMSDSRIVENWLLSIEDDQASTEFTTISNDSSPSLSQHKVLQPSESREDYMITPTNDSLEQFIITNPSESNNQVELRIDDMVTPTNDPFEENVKSNALEPSSHQVVFETVSNSENGSLTDEELADIDQIKTFIVRTPAFGRQVSESSQYTHDTGSGETAHQTAVNTIQNTMPSFTSEGNEIRKVNLTSGSLFKPIKPKDIQEIKSILVEIDSKSSAETLQTKSTFYNQQTSGSTSYKTQTSGMSSSDCGEGQGRKELDIKLRHMVTVKRAIVFLFQ